MSLKENIKKPAGAVLSVGGVIGIGTLYLIIDHQVGPVQAQVNRLEDRIERRLERMEGKLDNNQKEIIRLLRDKPERKAK